MSFIQNQINIQWGLVWYMSRAILTACESESFFEPLWKNYYSPFFDEICMTEIQPNRYDFADITNQMNRKIPGLLERNNILVVTDIDEILVPNKDKWVDLGQYLDSIKYPLISCAGYNVIQMDGEIEFNVNDRITDQRNYWQKDDLYDKPVITKIVIIYSTGQHLCNHASLIDTDLVMFHLRDADVRRSFMRRGLIDDDLSMASFYKRRELAIKIPEKWRVI